MFAVQLAYKPLALLGISIIRILFDVDMMPASQPFAYRSFYYV
ncbi:hypothetical protein [Beggiatoa alba]|nr:hypothetical protein [Beggiatoa alba]